MKESKNCLALLIVVSIMVFGTFLFVLVELPQMKQDIKEAGCPKHEYLIHAVTGVGEPWETRCQFVCKLCEKKGSKATLTMSLKEKEKWVERLGLRYDDGKTWISLDIFEVIDKSEIEE